MRAAPSPLVLSAIAAMIAAAPPQREMGAEVRTGLATRVQALASIDALPARLAVGFPDPAGFVQTPTGHYLVFDRRAQAVYSIDSARTAATKIVEVGDERGRIIRPTAFAAEPDGAFVIADLPGDRVRIQRFAERGYLLNGFMLPAEPGPHMVVEGLALGAIGSLQSTGDSIFISRPQSASLITEYNWDGQVRRSFGALRPTGHEADAAVHTALNTGLALVDPTGGFDFVFQAGVPLFRKYDRAGNLVYERHVEGRELDDTLRNQPAGWPTRRAADGQEWPAVPAIVRAAAVDPAGNLWIVLDSGVVYVYSPDGDKVRTLQLRGAGPLVPVSLFFAGRSRLLVAPGCYIFDVSGVVPPGADPR